MRQKIILSEKDQILNNVFLIKIPPSFERADILWGATTVNTFQELYYERKRLTNIERFILLFSIRDTKILNSSRHHDYENYLS